uniref:Iron-binding zinc finger CDGSH type domain-containing protein n=1 Tax=Panagrolaimus sp. ES5 TaxID=591445 RepID=A0AC34GQ76_9BILA
MVFLSVIRFMRLTPTSLSSKTGFGPYRLHRKGIHFVGTEPSPLKYHVLADKKPEQNYGLQGMNHLLPGKGKVHSKLPTRAFLKKDKIYAWCSCGYSGSQPLCDGSHNSIRVPDLKLKPVRFIPEKDMEVWFCNCKQTKNRPFCDGSHKDLVEKDKLEGIFD